MHPDPSSDPLRLLRSTTHEIGAVGLRLAAYAGILALLVVAAATLWEQLPDAVAQAREVAVTAGWMIDPPPLRGSL